MKVDERVPIQTRDSREIHHYTTIEILMPSPFPTKQPTMISTLKSPIYKPGFSDLPGVIRWNLKVGNFKTIPLGSRIFSKKSEEWKLKRKLFPFQRLNLVL
jgi:hypothetical protein